MKRLVSTAVALCLILACGLATAKGKKSVSGVVNINTAGIAELTMLPGIGPSKAQAIMDYRKDHPFQKPDDLKDVRGIGDKLFASIQQYVVVSGQTTATAAAAAPQPATKAAPGTPAKAF
jgi:competence ComEA-like helix-hairpin-helix protein